MKPKLLLGLALVLSGIIFTGESSNAQDADSPPATNVISRFLETRLANLSLTRSPSVSRQFEFDVLAAYPAIPDLPRTVMRVVANQDQAAVLIQATNALPYCLMENGLVVVCDPKRGGGLAYYEGNTLRWNFSKKNKDGKIDYSLGIIATNLPPEVDLDLRSILQDVPLDRVKVTFDQQNRMLQLTSSKVFLSVTISQKGDSKSFGADRIEFGGGGVALAISDIHVGVPLALQALFGLSKADIEKIGLPLRRLNGNEFTNILTVPPNFPASDKEAVAAKRLQSFLVARCAQPATKVPAQTAAPDFQTTLAKVGQGDVKAQANLGIMYIKGEGVKQDYAEAAKWLRLAADKGDAQSQYNLAKLYDEGLGLPQSTQDAIHWYLKAADNKYPEAALNLGVKYSHGEGVVKDYTNALKWIRSAADAGLPVACDYVGLFYAKGYGVATDSSEAVRWYRKAAEKGSAWAQTELGVRYGDGNGVEQDRTEAIKWLQKAAEQGYPQAQSALGTSYLNGWGVATNFEEAVKWFRLAANQGNDLAEAKLGVCYILGQGVAKDSAKAYKWLNLAAKQGNSKAIQVLGPFSLTISPEEFAEGRRRADAFVPQPKDFPDEPQ